MTIFLLNEIKLNKNVILNDNKIIFIIILLYVAQL